MIGSHFNLASSSYVHKQIHAIEILSTVRFNTIENVLWIDILVQTWKGEKYSIQVERTVKA